MYLIVWLLAKEINIRAIQIELALDTLYKLTVLN
jgi:hypothetical protein